MSDITAAANEVEALRAQIAALEGQLAAAAPLAGEDIPRYRLIWPCYLDDDVLHGAGEEIAFLGTPNAEAMEPLNEAARRRLIPIIAGITKKPLDQQIYDAKVAIHARDRAAAEPEVVSTANVEFAKADKTVPTMGDDLHLLPGQRKRGRPKKVLESKMPVDDGRPKPGLMGTVVIQGRDGTYDTGGGLNR